MRRSSSLIGGKLWRTSVVVLLGGNGRLKAPFLLAVTAKNLPFALPPSFGRGPLPSAILVAAGRRLTSIRKTAPLPVLELKQSLR